MSAPKECCGGDCNQGRDCPSRKEGNIPDAVISVSIGIVVLLILAAIQW